MESQADPEDPWFLDDFRNGLSLSRKKRKIYSDICSDDDAESDYSHEPTKNAKIIKYTEDVNYHEAYEKVGNQRDIVVNLMRYLSDDNLRSFARVSRMWCETAKGILRRRMGNHPFVLLWKSQGLFQKFRIRQFVYEIECEPKSIQATFFSASSSLDVSDIPLSSSDFLQGVTYSFGFADKLVVTTPDFCSTSEIDSTQPLTFAIQALCIPKSNRLLIKGFLVPAWSASANEMEFLNEDMAVISARFLENCATPSGFTLKGMTLLQYQDDPLVKNLMERRLSYENQTIPLVGGVLDNLISSEMHFVSDRLPLACGWAIFGTHEVRITSVALEMSCLQSSEVIYDYIREHFQRAVDGFILIFYNGNSTQCCHIIDMIRHNVPSRIPVVGTQSIGDLSFQGNAMLENGQAVLFTYPNVDRSIECVKMICLLVAY